jgi:hypothetical protein
VYSAIFGFVAGAVARAAFCAAVVACGGTDLFIDADTAGARRAARRYYASCAVWRQQVLFCAAMQELHGRLFWRAVKRFEGDSDA